MSSWDFLTRFLSIPFLIMQRISRNVYLLGRALFGTQSKPAIKPPPAKATATTEQEPLVNKMNGNGDGLGQSIPKPKQEFVPVPIPDSDSEKCNLDVGIGTNTKHNHNHEEIRNEDKVERGQANSITTQAMMTTNSMTPSSSSSSSACVPLQLTLVNELTRVTQNSQEQQPSSSSCRSESQTRSSQKRLSSEPKRNDDDTAISNPVDDHDEFKSTSISHNEGEPSNAKKARLSKDLISSTSTSISSIATKASTSKGPETLAKKKKKRPKKNKKDSENKSEKDGMTMGRMAPPNFFLAVQVSERSIINKVRELQDTLSSKPLDPPWHELKSTEIFRDAMVPLTKLHFTLYVMNLRNDEEVEKARVAVTECCSAIQEEFKKNPLNLTIEGLGHFRNSVIFAQIKEEEQISRLTKLSELLRGKLDEHNILGDSRPLKAHMTIAKISRSNKLHKKKIRAFPSEIWAGCEDTHFGVQRVNGVQLLSMQGEDKLTGYYRSYGEFKFFDDDITKPTPSTPISISPGPSRPISKPETNYELIPTPPNSNSSGSIKKFSPKSNQSDNETKDNKMK